MSAVATPRRTPAERALLEALRADAWRLDDPERIESIYLAIIRTPGRFDAFELNVLYEMLMLGPTCITLMEQAENMGLSVDGGNTWMTEAVQAPAMAGAHRRLDLASLPFQMIISTLALVSDPNARESEDKGAWPYPSDAPPNYDDTIAERAVDMWRKHTRDMRTGWRNWTQPTAMPNLSASAFARAISTGNDERAQIVAPVLTLACEAVMKIAWLFECEERDALVFGAVSDRRLPQDRADAASMLRRFAEQQPELRKVPAYVHVAPRDPDDWMRPRDYVRALYPAADRDQTLAVVRDAIQNRRYIHDHIAVIEVDRNPIKMLVLAPEVFSRETNTVFLEAMVVHTKGAYLAEVMLNVEDPADPMAGLVLPFGSHAWRGLAGSAREEHMQNPRRDLPPDQATMAIILAAWRDLIVANVREQQYESTVTRDDKKGGGGKDRSGRKAKRGHTKVVRYLPRTVVIRREEEADRAAREGGSTRSLSRPFRVGAFARALRDGQNRSVDANDYALEINLPLRDDQTVVRPHIRGGTDEEKEALLAQDDVRLWKSWAAIDLLFATRRAGAGA